MKKIKDEGFGKYEGEYHKVNIIQFLPYFPPHKGGLETVAQELGSFYVAGGYGSVINVVFDVGQDYNNQDHQYIFNQKLEKIGYKENGYTVYLLPAFDIVSNFPVPKFWEKKFWEILKLITTSLTRPLKLMERKKKWIIQTHTRFFLSSFLGGLFAKYHKLKWVHIEHGSDYVKLSSSFKSKIAYFYDRMIGKWIFRYCDKIIAISEGVKNFVQNEFIKKDIEIIYNGINFIPQEKNENKEVIKIGFVGRLVKLKGVDMLIEVFHKLKKIYPNIILEIVGDGEEREKLQKISSSDIRFLGMKNRGEVAYFLSNCDILVNPSFQEGLPTTVLEGLLSKCVVVATDVGGTKEISDGEDLIIVEKGNIKDLQEGLEKAIINYNMVFGKSFQSVKERFDWDKNIEKYFNLYKKI